MKDIDFMIDSALGDWILTPSGEIETVHGKESALQAVWLILGTQKGEYFQRVDFGTDFILLYSNEMNLDFYTLLEYVIRDAIKTDLDGRISDVLSVIINQTTNAGEYNVVVIVKFFEFGAISFNELMTI